MKRFLIAVARSSFAVWSMLAVHVSFRLQNLEFILWLSVLSKVKFLFPLAAVMAQLSVCASLCWYWILLPEHKKLLLLKLIRLGVCIDS